MTNLWRFEVKYIKFTAFVLSGLMLFYLILIPDISVLKDENPDKTSFMIYRENEWKHDNKNYKIKHKWVPYSRISSYIKKAVIVAEDDKFWSHDGFDFDAIKDAMEANYKAKKFKAGASTITQQLAKNIYLSPSKNPLRKMKEALITWRMEKVLSKRRILELYLNSVEWGDKGIFGIEAASRYYFGKPASALNPEESSKLAAILPNPRKYNPLKPSRYVLRKSDLIYRRMVRRGIVVAANNR
ncbi:monofunctional biosynthetic peptidoglycan transglycosylase [Candidatus Desantisbacteria bacterium]|nr:monofunctional biosynthetic peptidoglycan transglycosylase [Candidatus Desantisbacteria bacterium]